MAENSAQIVIGADVSGAMGGINQLIGSMPGLASAVASGFSIAAVTSFVRESIDAADALGKLAQKTGVSTEVLSGYQRAAELSDVSTQSLAGAFRALSKNMGEGKESFDKYGISINDANGKMLSADQVFAQIADKMQQMQDGPEKAAMAMDLLGKAGADLIPMLNDGSAGLEKMRLEAEMTGGVIGSDFAEQAQRFNDNLTQMGQLARGVGNDIAAYFLPALNGIAEWLNSAPENRLSAINEELAKLRGSDDYTGFADVRIAKLEEERAALDRIVKLEQQRKALAGSAALGDIRDARDRVGEADRQGGAIAKFEAGRKTGKDKTAKAAKWDGPGFDSATQNSASDIADVLSSNEAYERDIARAAEAEEKKTEAYKQGLAQRWEAMVMDNMTKDEMEMQRYEEKLAALEVMRANELISEQTFEEQRAQIQINAAQKASSAQLQIAAAQASWEKMTAQQKTQFMLSQAMALTAGFATQSKTAFEINKKLSIAQATMTTYDNAVKAFNAYASIPYVGPILGAVAAASAIAFGMAQVSQIKSQQFGGGGASGGGSIPSMPSYSPGKANAQMLEGDTMPGQAQPVAVMGKAETARTQVNVTLVGSAFDYNTVATELIPLLNDAAQNGAEIRVQRG